jgi:hypothetical protein
MFLVLLCEEKPRQGLCGNINQYVNGERIEEAPGNQPVFSHPNRDWLEYEREAGRRYRTCDDILSPGGEFLIEYHIKDWQDYKINRKHQRGLRQDANRILPQNHVGAKDIQKRGENIDNQAECADLQQSFLIYDFQPNQKGEDDASDANPPDPPKDFFIQIVPQYHVPELELQFEYVVNELVSISQESRSPSFKGFIQNQKITCRRRDSNC